MVMLMAKHSIPCDSSIMNCSCLTWPSQYRQGFVRRSFRKWGYGDTHITYSSSSLRVRAAEGALPLEVLLLLLLAVLTAVKKGHSHMAPRSCLPKGLDLPLMKEPLYCQSAACTTHSGRALHGNHEWSQHTQPTQGDCYMTEHKWSQHILLTQGHCYMTTTSGHTQPTKGDCERKASGHSYTAAWQSEHAYQVGLSMPLQASYSDVNLQRRAAFQWG